MTNKGTSVLRVCYILNVELTGFTDELAVKLKTDRSSRTDSRLKVVSYCLIFAS